MRPKVLLDTTYLLPLFGIAIDISGFEAKFPKLLKSAHVSVNSLSILEAKWKVLRLSEGEPRILERFADGLLSLAARREVEVIEFHRPTLDQVATSLYRAHRDYFDCSIASAAILYADFLATEDETLTRLVNGFSYGAETAKWRAGLTPKAKATPFHRLAALLRL